MRLILVFLVWLLTFLNATDAQIVGRIGLVYTLGQPVNRLGGIANLSYFKGPVQLNAELRLQRDYSTYGTDENGYSGSVAFGGLFGFGPPEFSEERFFFHPAFPQFDKRYATGYVWTWYLDQQGTSQATGTVHFHLDQFHLVLENDAFSPGSKEDKYRTGAAAIYWQTPDWVAEFRTVLWHGNTRGENARSVKDSNYPCRWGYRDFSNCYLGNVSHGVAAGMLHLNLGYGQVWQIGAGVDAEQIRNFVQNKLIHDLWWFPSAWTNVRNLHYPMLTEEGEPYLYLPGQKIRPVKAFWQLGLNDNSFY